MQPAKHKRLNRIILNPPRTLRTEIGYSVFEENSKSYSDVVSSQPPATLEPAFSVMIFRCAEHIPTDGSAGSSEAGNTRGGNEERTRGSTWNLTGRTYRFSVFSEKTATALANRFEKIRSTGRIARSRGKSSRVPAEATRTGRAQEETRPARGRTAAWK